MDKINVLTFIEYYLPGYKAGGPLRTLSNMTEQLAQDINFWIVTSDRDALDLKRYPNIYINRWSQVNKAQVFYSSPDNRSISSFAKLINSTPHDVVYLNSFFDPVFTLRPLLAAKLKLIKEPKKVIIAPRGEFSPNALKLKKFKKSLYMFLSRITGFYDNVVWHASSDQEARNIKSLSFGSLNKIAVALDMSSLAATNLNTSLLTSSVVPLKIAFISRITPMKNLDFALNVLSGMTDEMQFNIYGSIDDHKYWNHCKNLIDDLPKNVTATYHGAVPHNAINEAFANNHLLFFPSRGESYGHVINEALSIGLPVLTSDQTPWHDLERKGVGWTIPLNDPDRFLGVINTFLNLSSNERLVMQQRCRNYAEEVALDSKILNDNRNLFLSVFSA